MKIDGGERGIRTLGTLARSTVFETAPFDHSGTSPRLATQGSQVARNIDKVRRCCKPEFGFYTWLEKPLVRERLHGTVADQKTGFMPVFWSSGMVLPVKRVVRLASQIVGEVLHLTGCAVVDKVRLKRRTLRHANDLDCKGSF
jgi:hypothetical protein